MRADGRLVEPQALGQEDRVAGDVLRVALRVAVLGVDGEDEALQDVEARALDGPSVVLGAGHADRVATAGLGRLRASPRRSRAAPSPRSPSRGYAAIPALMVIGRRSGGRTRGSARRGRRAAARSPARGRRIALGRRDDEELVGPVAADRPRPAGSSSGAPRARSARTVVADPWPWVSLSSVKLSTSIRATPTVRARRPRRLDPAGQRGRRARRG